jgi:transglutaminase-like putative cysteine protease
MTLTVAVAVVLVSTVLFPAFLGTTWFYAGIGAAVTVVLFGALGRIRTLPVVVGLLISLIGLLLYLNLVFESSRSIIRIIPSAASMVGLWHLTHLGFTESAKYAAPAPVLSGLMLLSTASIGFTAVLTDLIAVRLRSAAMAGLPLLVLFTVPVAINGNRSAISIIVIFTLATCGYLALLNADGRERIRVWGRLISLWRTYEQEPKDAGTVPGVAKDRSPYQVLRGPDTRSLTAAGRRVAMASIVLALCVPLLIPGLHAARLASSDWVFGTPGGANTPGLYDPLTAAAQDLKQAKPTTVLTYTTTASAYLQKNYPQYLQQYVYTTLTDDQSWEQPFTTRLVTFPFDTQLPAQAPGVTNGAAPLVQTVISISKSADLPSGPINLLPAPFPPTRVYLSSGSWQYEKSSLMILTQHGSLNGLDYRVVSHDVDPLPQQLSKSPTPPAMAAYTQLPVSYRDSTQLRKLTLKLTNGSTTEYGKASAIANWLNHDGKFTYNTYAASIEDVSDLLNYLTKTKTGDCVQSAFAMTVLLRVLGIPARLAVGFTQGTTSSASPGPGATYVVKSDDAHAWPEVFFSGYGWMRFEPTPGGQGSASPPGYAEKLGGSLTTGATGGPTTAPLKLGGKPLRGGFPKPDPGVAGSGGTVAAKSSPGTPWLALALAVLAAVGLACLVVARLAPAGQRALAARPNPGPRQRVSAGAVLAVLAVAGVVALALYRVLSRTKGLNLGSGWETVGIAFGAACGAALLVPATWRFVDRRWRWMRAADNNADLAHAAWEELRADLADYGVGYLPSESPRALAGRITTGLALAEPAIDAVARIALAEERATYAARPSDAEGLRQDGSTVRRGIAEASGRTARWRARLFPASTMAAIADLAARVPEAWATRIRLRLFSRGRDASIDS